MLELDDDLAAAVPGFDKLMRVGDPFERQPAPDIVHEAAVGEGGTDRGDRLLVRLAAHRIDENEADGRVEPDQGPERERRLRLGIGSIGRDHAVRVQQPEARFEIGAERDLDDPVDSASRGDAGERSDLGRDIAFATIDHPLGARLPGDSRLVVIADRGDDAGAAEAGELDRIIADRAGTAGDQDRLSLDRTVGEHAAMRGHRRNTEAGAFGERGAVGQGHGLVSRQGDMFRCGAERSLELGLVEPDTFADAAGRDAVSHRLDRSGAILVRHDARIRHGEIAARAAASLGVGRIYCRRPDPDEDFAGTGRRPVEVADDQNLAGGALAVVPGGSHGRCLMAVSRCEMSRLTSRPAMDRLAVTGSRLLIPPDERWRGLGHALIRNARGKALPSPVRPAPISAATGAGIPGGAELELVHLAQGDPDRFEDFAKGVAHVTSFLGGGGVEGQRRDRERQDQGEELMGRPVPAGEPDEAGADRRDRLVDRGAELLMIVDPEAGIDFITHCSIPSHSGIDWMTRQLPRKGRMRQRKSRQ